MLITTHYNITGWPPQNNRNDYDDDDDDDGYGRVVVAKFHYQNIYSPPCRTIAAYLCVTLIFPVTPLIANTCASSGCQIKFIIA